MEAKNDGVEQSTQNPIVFSSQKDKKYQYVVDQGVAPDLASANLCWVAAVETAISPFVPAMAAREDFMHKFIFDIAKLKSAFDSEGRFDLGSHLVDLVGALQKTVAEENTSIEITCQNGFKWDDFQELLNAGNILIFGSSTRKEDPTGHVMVMDRILFQEGNYAVFNILDPAEETPASARHIISNREMYLRHNNNLGVTLPFLIIFKKSSAEK